MVVVKKDQAKSCNQIRKTLATMVGKTDQRIAKLILAIGPGKMPRRALMADMNLKGRRNFRVNYMTPAMDKGYVRFLFSDAPNSPEQAYFLTKEGMAILRKLKEE